jgi:hypothetical protein
MTHLLVALALLAAYTVFVLISPDHPCGRCSGWGNHHGRRNKACPRCDGTGRRFRPGAQIIHRGTSLLIRTIRDRIEGDE